MSYATTDDLDNRALPPDIRSTGTPIEKQSALDSANGIINGYLRQAGFITPIDTPGDDVIEAEVAIAAWRLAMTLGLAPEGGEKSNLYLRNRDAIKWLQAIAGGRVSPIGAIQDAQDEFEGGGIYILGDNRRGW